MLRNTDRRVFILIDALDESRSRNSLLTWIGRLTAENARILLTARPEDEIRTQIVRFIGEENCLSLDKRAVNSDIKSYVLSLLDTHPKFTEKGSSEELRNEICTKIGDGADGMFRWAACQMDALEGCLTPNDVQQALVSLPRNLYETYDRMLGTIPPHKKSDCIRLLQFVLNAEQPLSPAEAVEILATRSDLQDRLTFEPGNRLFKPSNIVRYCPGMISIVTVARLDPHDRKSIEEEVHLTHFSVKEYLGQKSTFCPLNAAIAITQTSLAYLRDINGPFYRMCVDFPLATRAADTWTRFASRAQSDEKIVEIIAKFLLGTENLSKCYRISTSDIDWYQTTGPRTHPIPFYKRSMDSYSPGDSGLHYACKNGLQNSAVYIMKHAPLDVQAEQKEVSLVTAIQSKHLELVEILLEHSVNPDASHPSYGTAVNNASNLGLTELVRVLIEAGADVNIESTGKGCCNAALCSASEHGHLDIVEDLLEAGAHVRLHDSVRLALENGHDAVVELLTERACEIRPVCGELLKSAASHGTIEFLQRLLDTKPDFLCKSRALTSACKAGRLEIARLLLSSGAKVDYYSPKPEDYLAIQKHLGWIEPFVFRENSLVLAAKSGNAHLVRMLIDEACGLSQGVRLHKEFEVATSIYVKKAFIKALEGPHQTVIRTLLDAMGSYA
ncbi:Pfs NACHT ankyrin domain-containing protein [Fusarium mexicanum]|uniref:Pfs NACHT ankyrin domain-containing protein n=1 Tax=Fusarium mexicanum TaxID=751941 RepID=A0A8H5INM4_9HYPO|nr:Pfs NACHT ankyrin domain-containing protein [Fusarium mexicanum]